MIILTEIRSKPMRVTSKGQVTIPRDLRELAGIEPNSEVIFSVESGKLVLTPKNGKREIEDRERLDRFMETVKRLEGSGDQEIDAEALMSITRDR
jgi:antitoxin PrlF